jgi:hypothetical protein
MSAYRHTLRAFAAGVAVIAAACGDNPLGPAKPVDPIATTARVQSLPQSFNSPVLQSFALAAPQSPATTRPLTSLQALLSAAGTTMSARRALSAAESQRISAALVAALPQTSTAVTAAILPPEVLGKTYEWNTTSALYEATARAGAPTNGVRFILYNLDQFGAPIVAEEIGYADLKDESTSATGRLHLLVVGTTTGSDVTYLDYTVAGSATTTTANVTVVGYVTDGIHRLDFNCTVAVTSTAVSADIHFDVNADNDHVRLRLKITPIGPITAPEGVRLDLTFRLQLDTEVITLTGNDTTTQTAESGSFTVLVNQGIYATIKSTNGALTFTGGAGQELTADDYAALQAIFDAVGVVLDAFNNLLLPAGSAGAGA